MYMTGHAALGTRRDLKLFGASGKRSGGPPSGSSRRRHDAAQCIVTTSSLHVHHWERRCLPQLPHSCRLTAVA